MKLFLLNLYLIKFCEVLFLTFFYCILFDGKRSDFFKFRHTIFLLFTYIYFFKEKQFFLYDFFKNAEGVNLF